MDGTPTPKRQRWGSRIGVILAVAGSAVGLGNFLRFPSVATENGGGAFMIPYLIAFLLLGIPVCWVEWTMGRYGGRYSHGSAPGILDVIAGRNGWAKYLGAIGIVGPLLIFFYYTYVESWALGYAWYSLTGKLTSMNTQEAMKAFLSDYQGVQNPHFSGSVPGYVFFLITFTINLGIVYLGVAGGIERVSKIAMPALAILGAILAVRVLTLGTPDPAHPSWNVNNGLGFMWNPHFESLKQPKVWLAAAGQIFFTLSVGIGCILTYASYMKPSDDVALSGLTASATNEFMEVIIGGSMVIPAAVVFYGAAEAMQIAGKGTFNLGFVTMPLIFNKMPGGGFFSFAWFLLLFFAAITSSISLFQPAVSFLEDEFKLSRRRSILFSGGVCFLFCQLAIFGLSRGFVDEMDFWAGNLFLVVFALIEVILFAWVFGIDRGWIEMNRGAEIRIPGVFKFVLKWVTPLYILVILVAFLWNNFEDFVLMKSYGATWRERIWVLGLRLAIFALVGLTCYLIAWSWKRHPKQARPEP